MAVKFDYGEDMQDYAEKRRADFARERGFERRQLGTRPRIQGGVGGRTLDLPIKPAAAWFKMGVGITQSGGFVSQWNDASGNNRHLKQTTATNQPQFMPDTSLLFDGIDNFMKCDAFTLNQPISIYVLGRIVVWSLATKFTDGDAANNGALLMATASPGIGVAAQTIVATNNDLAVGVYGAICGVVNGASSLVQINNGTATTGDAGANNPSGFTVGARGDGGGGFGNVQIKEIVLYAAAHSSTERAQVINYLRQVGGLQ